MLSPSRSWSRGDHWSLYHILLLILPVSVAGPDHLQRGADGGVPLLLEVYGPDLVEDVSEELDIEVVRHHGKYQPVTELENLPEIVRGVPRQARGEVEQDLHPHLAAQHRDQPAGAPCTLSGEILSFYLKIK